MRALALALCLVSTPAIAADQFDLICTAKKESVRYRIDLAAGEYCAGNCEIVQKIAGVTSGTLTLQDKQRQFPDDDRIWNTINRATGEWYRSESIPSISLYETTEGRCEPATFSGIAPAKTKF